MALLDGTEQKQSVALTGTQMAEALVASHNSKTAIENINGMQSNGSQIDESVNLAHPSLNHFLSKIERKDDNISIFVNGDSTGDASDEWVYYFAEWLFATYPEYTVRYRDWNNTTNVYEAFVTIGTGSGSFNIDIWNACTGSQPVYYLLNIDKTENAIKNITDNSIYADVSSTVDLTIVNHSHNHYGEVDVRELLLWNANFTEEYINFHPSSSWLWLKQNPWRDNYNNLQRVLGSVQWANIKDFAIADVWSKFENLNKDSSLYFDNIHPSTGLGTALAPTGTRLFLEAVTDQLTKKVHNKEVFANSTLNICTKAINVNPNLLHTDDNLPPDPYTLNGCVVEKDTTNFYDFRKGYSTKVIANGGASCYFRYRLGADELPRIVGKDIIIAILMYSPYTDVSTKNIIDISTSSGGHVVHKNLTHLSGGWNWRFIPAKAVKADTYLNIYIQPSSTSATTAGEYINIDKIIVLEGNIPFGESI